MPDTGRFMLLGASTKALREQADDLDGVESGIVLLLDRGHLSLNPAVQAVLQQIEMRVALLRQLALEAALKEPPINEVAS